MPTYSSIKFTDVPPLVFMTSPWGWRFIVETCSRVNVYGKHNFIVCVFWCLRTVVVTTHWTYNFLFYRGLTAPSAPGPPHYRGFTITLRHTAPCRTPLDEWSAQHTDLYWQHTTLTTKRNLGFRLDSNPQSQQASGRRSTPQTARPLGICGRIINKLKRKFVSSASFCTL